MFPQGPSNTALLTAAARALENKKRKPLFSDPYSEILAGDEGKGLLEDYGEAFVLVETIRTKFFDDAIMNAAKNGKKQFIVLGAGLDTRPYRLNFQKDTLWFEVDFPPILKYKREILKDAKPAINIIDIPMSVTELDLKDFIAKGFNPKKESVWIAEGLIPYLQDKEVDSLLDLIAKGSVANSEIIMTCPNTVIIKRSDITEKRYQFMEKLNAQWIFSGTDKPEELFSKHGFKIEAVFVGHRRAHYAVLPWPAVDDLPPGYPKEWFITGTRA